MEMIWQDLRKQILEKIDVSREISDEELREKIQVEVRKFGREKLMSLAEREQYEEQIFNSLRKLDILQELLDDPEVTEIMVNGPEHIFYEKSGVLYRWEKGHLTAERLADIIQQIAGNANRVVNEAQPILDTRLPDGSRVNVVLQPVALDGSCISIRKFSDSVMTLEQLTGLESISEEAADVLAAFVEAGYNIFISGGTGSGKTTLLNALSDFVPKEARIITIEDSAELQIKGVQNLVRLEARAANLEGENEITIRDLIKASLRLRPDRIIVGEVRDAAAIDMLAAMGTGHDGSLSTGHANSAKDMLIRLETMVLMGMEIPLSAVRRQIAAAVDIVIHVSRLRDKSRKIIEICEVNGMEHGEIRLNTLVEFQETGTKKGKVQGVLRKVNDLIHIEKLQSSGLLDVFEEAVCGLPGV